MTLYVATTNPGKLRDFAAAAQTFNVDLQPIPSLHSMSEPVEDGMTFEANARKKAQHYSRLAPGLWVLADDSGLEVDALNGAPGVRSARFADDAGFLMSFRPQRSGVEEPAVTRDERNNSLLLERLRDIPTPRTARYRCVLAVVHRGICIATAEGTVEGEILREPRGTGGFGYDPLFYLPQLGKTMAEIDLATKQRISHRGNALKSLLSELHAHKETR